MQLDLLKSKKKHLTAISDNETALKDPCNTFWPVQMNLRDL